MNLGEFHEDSGETHNERGATQLLSSFLHGFFVFVVWKAKNYFKGKDCLLISEYLQILQLLWLKT